MNVTTFENTLPNICKQLASFRYQVLILKTRDKGVKR